ncbi:AfsR/SARP family transcriptional regulator [Saccharothrix coeruleofusca]|uniref:SARP family transcriptional regulator n=1 Tax=Saccharothrix coeruleofusca TaxID=33919 RepID=A0A918AMI8_9PSEU|nr:BTAD domain-containing putative transcriptional regulator [Saccharothrix coeruleofusca]GGP58289.1 SARP family transcriptional regulator [Saccharothrix coeruleofusca]
MSIRFEVLGPLRVWHGGVLVPVPLGKVRVLLATLLLRAGRPVSAAELEERLWGGPARSRSALHMVVTRLRRVLGAARVVHTVPEGYLAELEEGALDLHRFRALAAEERFAEALALWRGAPLPDVRSDQLHEELVPLLEERLFVLERRVEADLAAGRCAELVAELRGLTGQHPLRERFWGQLMRALYHCGRQAEALSAYRSMSRTLADELGVDPSAELRELHQRILREEVAVRPAVVPQQLPLDVAAFSGRQDHLNALDALLTGGGTPVGIVVLTGVAGIGKTALAVRWAHRVRHRFDDGQLFVDLRGYDSAGPLDPDRVLAQFLRALGVPAERLPAEREELTALYRSHVADRRLLVVLDNAASAAQVRPLLPGSATCAVVITSRGELRSLAAFHGARSLRLEVLPAGDSAALLRVLLPGVGREERAELAELCGYLPLALRIAAANMAGYSRPDAYLDALRGSHRLAHLVLEDDPGSAVRPAFELSRRALNDATQRVFRLLAVVPGPDFDRDAVADLVGCSREEADRVLDRLVSASLVEHGGQGRHHLHDLLREYAKDLLDAQEAEEARTRLFEGYLVRVLAAAAILYPHMPSALPDGFPADPGVFGSRDAALAWLDAEHPNLLSAIADAAARGPRAVAWRLAFGLRGHFWARRRLDGWLEVGRAALAAARAESNPIGCAAAELVLAVAEYCASRTGEAIGHYRAALDHADLDRWPQARAIALGGLGLAHRERGQLTEAAECFRSAFAVNTESGRAINLSNLGAVAFELGDLVEARVALDRALEALTALESPIGQAVVLNTIGGILRLQGDFISARDHQDRALVLFRSAGHTRGEAATLENLAVIASDCGDHGEAVELASAALALAEEGEDLWNQVDALNALAGAQRLAGRCDAAADGFRRALRLAAGTGYVLGEIRALCGVALVPGEEDVSAARRAVDLASGMGARIALGQAGTALARVHLVGGDVAAARRAAEAALLIQREGGYRVDEEKTLSLLAEVRAAGAAQVLW